MINPSEKPVVKYKASEGCLIRTNLENKSYAIVFPVNHPDRYRVSNQKYVLTSEVIKSVQNEQGIVVEFETRNTKYVIDFNS